MKSLTRIIFATAVSAILSFTANRLSAQQTLASWYSNPLTSGGGTPPAAFPPNTANPDVTVTPLAKGVGIGVVTTAGVYGGNTWTNVGIADSESSSITNGLYITYVIQADPGYTISFSTNVLAYHDSGTGPGNGELQYSTDGINYSDIVSMGYIGGNGSGNAATTFTTNILSGIPQLQNVPSTVTNYFRIVNWGATSTAGTWYMEDNGAFGTTNGFLVMGSVTPVPQPIATWYPFPLGETGGGPPPAPFTNNYAPLGVTVYPMTKGPGLGTDTSFNEAYGANGWTNNSWNGSFGDTETGAIANGDYISYAIQAATNYTVSFSTNYLYYDIRSGSSAGPTNEALQYSTDNINFTNLLVYTNSTGETTFTNNLSGFAFLQNVPFTVTNYFRFVNWGAANSNGYWFINAPTPAGDSAILGTNGFAVIGGVTSLTGPPLTLAPTNATVSPSSVSTNAGQTVDFSVSAGGSPATYYQWYYITNYNLAGAATNLIANATNATLILSNVVTTMDGAYYAILTNTIGSATSTVATLTIVDDPAITIEPNNTYGLLDGPVLFSVTVAASTPTSYQWWLTDPSGDLMAPINNGTSVFGDGSAFTGANTSLLELTNAQYADLTNVVVVITNAYGAVTSSVASILEINSSDFALEPPYFTSLPRITPIAIWDFDGSNFVDTITNPLCQLDPTPYLGVGTAFAVGGCYDPGTSPFSGSVDPNDNTLVPIVPGVPRSPDFSWGTDNYPASGGNKQNGVQFNVSTVGAKNIILTYDSRLSSTASEYERVQYTTNGTSWFDYPSSSSFDVLSSTYEPFSNNFTGFPGVANNPNFGVRVVTEVQSTATYGVSSSTNYVGTANTYGTAGTVTYDLVGLFGTAITNNNIPPVISTFTNLANGLPVTNEITLDNIPVTNSFIVSGDANPTQFTYSATSLNSATVFPNFTFTSDALGQCTMVITPNSIVGNEQAGPILVTVTDTNGDSTAAWFLLTLNTQFPAPTVSVVPSTNTLLNTTVSVPFTVGSVTDSVSQFTYSTSSDNNTVLPGAGIFVTTNNPGTQTNPVVSITPAANQLGVGVVGLTIDDNDTNEAKFTTTNISVMVRPNTNVVFLDYFNYDDSGGGSLQLDQIAAFWTHLTGTFGHLSVFPAPSGGYVQVDTVQNTENMEAPLFGAPYATNSATVTNLYYSVVINVPAVQPGSDFINSNGTYICALNDGVPQATADVEDLLMIVTNGAAPGDYFVGIGNDQGDTSYSNSISAAINTLQNLVPGSNYLIVTRLNLKTDQSTIWVNPTNLSSPSVTAPIDGDSISYNISDFELRQSGNEEGDLAGAVNVSYIEVGKTFNSVLQGPQIATMPTYTLPFGSIVTITNLSATAGWTDFNGLPLTITSVGPTSMDGTNVTTDGTNVFYGGPLVINDGVNYAISDGYLTNYSTVYVSPVLQFNGALAVNGSRNPVISGTSPAGADGYTYGVEYTTNLLTGTWFNAGTTTVSDTGAWTFTDINHTNPPVIFYRLYYPYSATPPQP